MNELIILETDFDDFIVVSGERIATETDPNFYPFTHAVTFRLTPESAARLREEVITVPETALLTDCELPKATEQPTKTETASLLPTPATQLTLDGKVEQTQPTLF